MRRTRQRKRKSAHSVWKKAIHNDVWRNKMKCKINNVIITCDCLLIKSAEIEFWSLYMYRSCEWWATTANIVCVYYLRLLLQHSTASKPFGVAYTLIMHLNVIIIMMLLIRIIKWMIYFFCLLFFFCFKIKNIKMWQS